MSELHNIQEEPGGYDLRRYFYMVPNLIDEMGLSIFAHRLYCHLKRVAGESGQCWQSTDTLATACKMSVHKIVDARRELDAAKLIRIDRIDNPNGGSPYMSITIKDIWNSNFQKFTGSLQEPDQVPTGNVTGSHRETKNNPLKKTLSDAKASDREPAKPRNLKDPALEIQSTLEGKVLWTELEYAFRSKGRSAPTYYATPQQRDAYQVVFAKLKDQLKPLIKKGFSRGIVSLDRLLAWLESCAINANGKRPVGSVPGTPEYYGTTKEPPKGTPEHAAWATEQTRLANELYQKYNS